MQDPKIVFGRAVRERRAALGWTQERLADEAGIHWTYVGSVERGERNISLENVVKLARALKTPVSDLMSKLD